MRTGRPSRPTSGVRLAQSSSTVRLALALALAAVSALGVVVGGLIGDYVPLEWVKRTAAVAFILIGVLMLLGKF